MLDEYVEYVHLMTQINAPLAWALNFVESPAYKSCRSIPN